MRLAPVLRRISARASTEVPVLAPVVAVIAAHRSRSRSRPSQPDDVPFHTMASTLASASSKAASRIGCRSNCASAAVDSEISVTRKRPKCTVTSGKPASIAVVTGSSTVLEDGVSMPMRLCSEGSMVMRRMLAISVPEPHATR